MQLLNRTPFAAERVLLPDPRGADTLVVVLKATFSVKPPGALRLADEQVPVQLADRFAGEPGKSSVLAASDLCPGKPGTDVVLRGSARPGRPMRWMDVSLRAGPCRKVVRVFGNRYWRGKIGLYLASEPEDFEAIPLTWENAFGGNDTSAEESEAHEYEPRNPVGRGFRARKSKLPIEGELLPNIEDPKGLIDSPKARPAPSGLGFLGRDWQPRLRWAGTYDEKWRSERMPLLPDDFDPRYHDRAPEGLIAAQPPKAGEPVEAIGVHPAGPIRFALPDVRPSAQVLFEDETVDLPLKLDTLVLDADKPELLLTFAGHTKVHGRLHDIEAVLVDAEGFE